MQIVIATPELARATHKLKQLIVTGDDFGRSHEVNEAIERCHEAGFLTQAGLMVHESHAEEAVRIAQRHPALCVGLHLTLCDGRASAISAITDAAGRFVTSPARAGLRYAFRSSLAESLQCEIRAQFERFRAFGLAPTYWDGHTHLHLHPTVLRLTLPIALEYGFRATRLVREYPPSSSLLPAIFRQLSRAAQPGLQRHGIAFNDRIFGLRDTGKMTTQILTSSLECLPDGLTEIYFHPGAEPEEIDGGKLRSLATDYGITLRTSLPPPSAH
ncbi:YdjC-like protein [Chthoniobacter flavus Ellin428]|uniref:YdjC-like protein n=1 Tax=Chthoniobacter flavus Ellin428 TaxID=497964 RepID=B4DB15_9BACT|nr:hopanoid biosynthesis-associated protein HpnK [Chthoniobacter flavus]EDY16389.1 YdjC-like protein [Chthoniobacter flavus Ellin428]TCO92478.1 hopanoid biosynthesis associated protein HpnK [Chthoniobacter flavus]